MPQLVPLLGHCGSLESGGTSGACWAAPRTPLELPRASGCRVGRP